MRPAGQISQALLTAAMDLVREEGGQRRGATLQEMAHHACVGIQAARMTVANLTRHGKLERIAERRVEYRNRPVMEYAPAQPKEQVQGPGYFDLGSVFTAWARG